MKRLIPYISLILATLLLLSACSKSLDEEQKTALTTTKETFNLKDKKINKKNDDIQYYLPLGMKVKKETPNNLLIKKGSKTYILFYNQNEEFDSTIVYESTILKDAQYILNETFKDKKRFGYFLLRELDKEHQELTVGIGGIKMTTKTTINDLSKDAQLMMEMVASVKIK